MPNVEVLDIPAEVLERLRAQARAREAPLETYLRDILQAQARYLRRQEVLGRSTDRLRSCPGVPEEARQAVLEAIDTENTSRVDELGGRTAR